MNQNIVFDNAVTNIGNAYHPIHGIFTAPVDGVYIFGVTVAGRFSSSSSGDQKFYAWLNVNGTLVVEFLAPNYEQSTHLVILQLRAGTDVSVKNSVLDQSVLGFKRYSSFSGFLLYESYGTTTNVVG